MIKETAGSTEKLNRSSNDFLQLSMAMQDDAGKTQSISDEVGKSA